MSVIPTDRPVPLGAVTAFRVVTFAERAWEQFVAWRRAQATERVLNELSDAVLADIGLHRDDIAATAERLARR